VDADRADRVIDLDLVEEQHREHHEHATDAPDHDRPDRGDGADRSRDGDEAGEDAVADHREVRLAGDQPDGHRRDELHRQQQRAWC
jgi:hypothetical protein